MIYGMGFCSLSQYWQLPDPPEKDTDLDGLNADSQEHVLRSAGEDHEHVKALRRRWRDGNGETM